MMLISTYSQLQQREDFFFKQNWVTFIIRKIQPEMSSRIQNLFTKQIKLIQEEDERRLSEKAVVNNL